MHMRRDNRFDLKRRWNNSLVPLNFINLRIDLPLRNLFLLIPIPNANNIILINRRILFSRITSTAFLFISVPLFNCIKFKFQVFEFIIFNISNILNFVGEGLESLVLLIDILIAREAFQMIQAVTEKMSYFH